MDKNEIAKDLTVAALSKMELTYFSQKELGKKIAELYNTIYGNISFESDENAQPSEESPAEDSEHFTKLSNEDVRDLFKKMMSDNRRI